jgi:pyruvate dehydrogenase E1 component
MTRAQLLVLRDRLHMQDEIPESAFDGDLPPYFHPSEDSIEYQYMMERRKALGGSIPKRVVRARKPLELPNDSAFAELLTGSGTQAVSTTMGFTR